MGTTPSGTAQKRSRGLAPSAPDLGQLHLEDLLAHAPAVILFLGGPELRCSYVNELGVKVIGRRSADQLLGHTFREALPELEGTDVFEILDEVAHSRQPFRGQEFRIPLLQFETGTVEDRFFDFVCQPMLDRDGALTGIFIYAVDLTDRVLNRRAFEASQDRL